MKLHPDPKDPRTLSTLWREDVDEASKKSLALKPQPRVPELLPRILNTTISNVICPRCLHRILLLLGEGRSGKLASEVHRNRCLESFGFLCIQARKASESCRSTFVHRTACNPSTSPVHNLPGRAGNLLGFI